MKQVHYIIILLGLILATSCKKESRKDPVIFQNKSEKIVHVSVYFSQADYYREVDPLTRIALPPLGTMEVPGDLFEEGRRYYYDWHTNDDSASNWGTAEYPLTGPHSFIPGTRFVTFTYPAEMPVACEYGDIARLVLLGGQNISATWKAVDAYDGGAGSAWPTMTPEQKNVSVVINKDYTAILEYAEPGGNIKRRELRFEQSSAQVTLSDWFGYTVYMSGIPAWAGHYSLESGDSLYLDMEGASCEYIMQRQ